jgi:hypothetical protein
VRRGSRTHETIGSRSDPLLALDDDALEDVMGAVYLWCSRHSIAIGSAEGQEAIRLAAGYRDDTKITPEQIVKLLGDQLRP